MNRALLQMAVGFAIGGVVLFGLRLWQLRTEAKADAAGYARAVAEYTAQALAESEKARATEQALREQLDKAVNDARKREQTIAAVAAAAGRERDGLREQITAYRGTIPGAPDAAVREYASTAGDLLGACAARYSELAAKADGHASDTRTLIEAWPRPSP